MAGITQADCTATADIHMFPLDAHFVSLVLTLGTSAMSTTDSVRYSVEDTHTELVFSYDAATALVVPGAKVVCRTQEEWVTSAVYWAVAQHVSGTVNPSSRKLFVPVSPEPV